MKVKWLDRTLVFGPYLCLCLSEQEFKSAFKYFGVDCDREWVNLNASTHYLKKDNSTRACVVCLNETKGRTIAEISSLLAHEAVHVWQYFCETVGEDNPSSEFEAYAVQNLTQTLVTEYMSRKDKK